MAQGPTQHSTHGAAHAHACGHDHAGARLKASPPGVGHHHHAPSTPHPAQAVPWSLLRMGLAARLGGSLLIVAALWIVVLAALRLL
ncbi:putative protein OS=Afipia felis OX=1035 GN=BN961_00276 PE=4 SV=1 [Afipia felis]